jgi:polysaccharide deacetylase family protein (PEP-CTERM system associated)
MAAVRMQNERIQVNPAGAQTSIRNAFTVDVEDYFQVTAFDHLVPREQWDQIDSRVVASTHRLLDLLARQQVCGTFFILGWTAERFPQLVREIQAGGHELACHSFCHHLIYDQTPSMFREDVRRAKSAIEDASGASVSAYRAPSFSITRRSMWALEVLVEEGFRLDSSVFPVAHDRYGIPKANTRLHPIETPAGTIWEFPLAIKRIGRWSLPISGGGYFRLFPFGFSRQCLASLNRDGQPFAFYIHPWEVDPDQPRIRGASRLSRFRHYVNLTTTERKLERLLASFRFGTISEVVAKHQEALVNAVAPADAVLAATNG